MNTLWHAETIDLKIEALLAHASQYIGRTEVAARQLRKQRARIGKKYNVAYAEEFHRALNL